MTKDPDSRQLRPYLRAGWQLIPLHRWDYTDTHKGRSRKRGKSPQHANWTKRTYRSEDQVDHMRKGMNVGVRLRSEDLVIDVDPRAFPEGETLSTDNPFRRLCRDAGLDPELHPTVETGSGGLHLYLKKPDDVSIRDSLPDYPGVEFKTLGRQVVSAGSRHDTQPQLYQWDFLRPDLDEVKDAPKLLLNIIRRPLGQSQATGGGEYDQEEIARMLDGLDPEEFRDHDAWFTLMQAVHHASAGDARSEFIEWCTRDPEYADHGAEIGIRWDSLHAGGSGPKVTYKTLLKTLHEHGLQESIPRAPAADDFDDDVPEIPDDPEAPAHEKMGPLERLNQQYWAVMSGGKFKIFYQQEDPTYNPPRKCWEQTTATDFRLFWSNRKLQRGERAVPMGEAWLEWGQRRTVRGVVFDPERDHKDRLNLWTGWGIQPRRKDGGWSILEDLLLNTLCDGDQRVFEYVMNWSAYLVQHPGSPAEVAICFQGQKGTGKGTFGRALATIAGRHGMQITSPEHLTGRFNSHLRDLVFLFADEAISPYDKASESRLKGLITEPLAAFEGKGENLITGKNLLHIMMASNEDWVVPMGLDGERRFMLARVNNTRQGDKAFFRDLHRQLEDGGYEALLWDLMNRDIADWAPRDEIPTTTAAIEQKVRGMSPVAQWWFNQLEEGIPAFEVIGLAEDDWELDGIRAFKQDVKGSFMDFCRQAGIKSGSSGRSLDMFFAQEIKKLVPKLEDGRKVHVPDDRPDVKAHGDGRQWAFEFPPLHECRRTMEALLGGNIDWPG